MDAATQESQCENLFTQGINVLILAPQDAVAAATIVDKAHAAGVKVISYDRLVMNTANDDVYISFDNVQVGVLQGTWLTTAVPKGNYAILSGAPTDNNAKLFKQGAMSIIQPLVDKGDIKIVADQPVVEWKPENAQKIMENALTANKNNIQGILAPNDGTAGGCIQALAAQGLAGKVPITGQDAELAAAQRIVKGTQGMTVFKDTRMLGDAAVEAAKTMFAGQPLAKATQTVNNGTMDVPSILLVPIAVTKENIDATLIASGYLLKADVYK
jgi:D-xylose transport system substrate-binding protein